VDELDPVFNRVAAYFGLLSEPMRLKIMHAVCMEEKSVSDIVAATGATQTNVSRHLHLMHRAGAVSRRKDGNQVYYKVADQTLVDLCRNVCIRIAAEIDEQQPMRDNLLQLLPGRPPKTPRKSKVEAAGSTAGRRAAQGGRAVRHG